MKATLFAVLCACGGSTPNTSPTPPAAPAVAAPANQWWCYEVGGELGSCFEQAMACQAARTLMVNGLDGAPPDEISECAAQAGAVCFSRGDERMCHPTFAMCRSHADHERREGHSIGDCTPVGTVTAATDPRWWCLSFNGGKVGSCARSRSRCEQDRTKVVELQQGGPVDVTPCTGQETAMCFDGAALCHPTLVTCQTALSYAQSKGRNTGEECRSTQ